MNPLVEKYGKEPRWVNWRKETRGDKTTKIPYTSHGVRASSTNFQHWSTYDVTRESSENVGIIFTPDKKLLGIDIDHCLENGKVTHEKKAEIIALLKALDTYTEISPSGTGLHAYLAISDEGGFTPTANRHAPYEFYVSGRYFTVTQQPFGSKVRDVRTVTAAEAEEILKIAGYPWGATEPIPARPENGSDLFDEKNRAKPAPKATKSGDSTPLSDEDVLTRMFASKNGAEIRALYDTDPKGKDTDASRVDMALLMHLAFWTQKDAQAMERLWLASPIGNRKKTRERADYRERSIRNAITKTKDVYEPTPRSENRLAIRAGTLELMMRYGKDGAPLGPIVSPENVRRIMLYDHSLRDKIRFNDFSHMIETKFNLHGRWEQMQNEDVVRAMSYLQREYPGFEKVSKEYVGDAMYLASLENVVNPPKDYFENLKWDGTPRIDEWLHHAYGSPKDALHASMGANWLKGLVKRVIEPGCKFDYVLILEGEQGLGKSRSFRTLGAPWHVEVVITPDNKDFYLVLQDNIIIEFSEGETMNRAETKKLKAVITMQEDDFRKPYGRGNAKYPRHCVFAMTTNSPQYLKDETGNRRYLPVEVKEKVNIDWLASNRDQLFAEAYQRAIVDKESTWEFPEEEITSLQDSRVISQAYEDELIEWYANKSQYERDQGVSTLQAYQAVWQQNAPMGREMSTGTSMVIGGMFKKHLHLVKRQVWVGGDTQSSRKMWFPSEKTSKLFPTEAQPGIVNTF